MPTLSTLPKMRGRSMKAGLVVPSEQPQQTRKKKRPSQLKLGLSLDAQLLNKLQDKVGAQSVKEQPPSVQRSFWQTETGVVRTLLITKQSISSGIDVTFESNEQGITRFSRVGDGGPGAAAGAMVGDRLLSVNGTHTLHGATHASHLIASCAPGLIELVVRRSAAIDKAMCHTVPLARALVSADLTKERNCNDDGKGGGRGGFTDDEISTDGSHSSVPLDALCSERTVHVPATMYVGSDGHVRLSLIVPAAAPAAALGPGTPTKHNDSSGDSDDEWTAPMKAQLTATSPLNRADSSLAKPARGAQTRVKGTVRKAAPRPRNREYLALATVPNVGASSKSNNLECTAELSSREERTMVTPQQEAFERLQKQCPRAEVGLLQWLTGMFSHHLDQPSASNIPGGDDSTRLDDPATLVVSPHDVDPPQVTMATTHIDPQLHRPEASRLHERLFGARSPPVHLPLAPGTASANVRATSSA